MIIFVWIHFVLPHWTQWSQTEQSPALDANNERRIINNCQKVQTDSFYQSHSSLSLCKPFYRSSFNTEYVFAEKVRVVLWISALQTSGKNCNRFQSPLSVWTNPVYETSWVSLPAKQAINVKLLHDWSNFDLPKLKPVEHISLMPSSCLSLTLMHAWIHANKLLITTHPIRNLRTPASAEMNKRRFLKQASLPLSPQSPSLFPFLPIPISTPTLAG